MENKNWKNLSVIQTIKSNMGILAGLVILCVVLSFTTSSFATVTNLFNVVRQITINLFLACGMTFVILLAGIDLSVGSVIAVSGCISAGLISWNGLPVYVGILGGILAGVVIGLINGYIVSSTNIPAFIVTLAMMNIGRGIARVYTKAQTISVLDDSYTFWGMGTIFGIPIQLYCIVAVIAVSSFILNKTKLGRHIYAVGGNKQAAEYSGINVKKVTFFVFVYSALLASLAGILTVGRTFTAMMTLGDGAEMDAISAVVLGAALIISFIFNVEIDVEVLIDALGFALPVITTSSIVLVLRESCSCANIIAPIDSALTVKSFLGVVCIFIFLFFVCCKSIFFCIVKNSNFVNMN